MMYLHFSEIHAGDLLYEEVPSMSLQVRVLDEPVQDGDKWTFNGFTASGQHIHYLMTDGLSHYGPRLSKEPTRGVVMAFG